jgi:hypothetical protein
MVAALNRGSDLRSSGSSGDRQRVYSVKVSAPGRVALIQVTRSTEPEHEALSKLLAGLLIGGVGGLVLAGVGGWWLAASRCGQCGSRSTGSTRSYRTRRTSCARRWP